MKSKWMSWLIGGLLITITPGLVRGQKNGTLASDQTAAVSGETRGADKIFAIKAAQGGLAEVQLGKLVAEKATDPEVKAFGLQMVEDHTKINDQLKTIAQRQGLTLPESMGAQDRATYDGLEKLPGPTFDRAYVNEHD
jgi:putative membrane protein